MDFNYENAEERYCDMCDQFFESPEIIKADGTTTYDDTCPFCGELETEYIR